MSTSVRVAHRRARASRLIVGVLIAALLALLAANLGSVTVASAKPTTPPITPKKAAVPPQPARVAAALADDRSLRLPALDRGETTGDFLGRGYDQRAVFETDKINIYDSPSRGGGLIKSTATDLKPFPSELQAAFPFSFNRDVVKKIDPFKVYLFWTPEHLYAFGTTNANKFDTDPTLYQLPPDFSCGTASCVTKSTKLPRKNFLDTANAPTALAVGKAANGRNVIAVGTSAFGVQLFDDTLTEIVSSKLNAWKIWRGSRDLLRWPVISLAFDQNPVQTLAVGVMWPGTSVGFVELDANGSPLADAAARVWQFEPGGSDKDITKVYPAPTALAFGKDAVGNPVAAIGQSDGTVNLYNPAVSAATVLSKQQADGVVTGVAFVDRWDGTGTAPDVVVARGKVFDTDTDGVSQVLRNTGSTLEPQPLGVRGATSTTVPGLRAWYPGYRTGRVRLENKTQGEPISVRFASRPNAAYGCFYGPRLSDGAAFPVNRLDLGAGGTSETFTFGGLTAGAGGGCAATDVTGEWAAYLTITPTLRPGDTTVVKMKTTRTGQVSLQTTTRGALAVEAVQDASPTPYGLGRWRLTITGPPLVAGTTGSQPKLTMTRLTPESPPPADGTPAPPPIYRFDIAALTYALPFSAPPRATAVLPSVGVGAYFIGGGGGLIGYLVPQGPPVRSTAGTVTLAPMSFYWQNTADLQVERIFFFSGNTGSPVYRLASAPAPAAGPQDTQLSVCPVDASKSCDGRARPFANGLDQGPLRVDIRDADNVALPLSNPLYQRLWYTDQAGRLITNLMPTDGSTYTRVSPYPGLYRNDGSTGIPTRPPVNAPVGGRYAYISTTSTDEQEITPHVPGVDESSTSPIVLDGEAFAATVAPGSTGATGITLTGCADYAGSSTCRLAVPSSTNPVLYRTDQRDSRGGPYTGLEFLARGWSAQASLPLQQVAGQPEHTVADAQLDINNGEATLANTSVFQPGDSIDAFLVSHGQRVPVQAVRVGGGN